MVKRNPSFWDKFDFSCENFTRLFKGKIIAELDTIQPKTAGFTLITHHKINKTLLMRVIRILVNCITQV